MSKLHAADTEGPYAAWIELIGQLLTEPEPQDVHRRLALQLLDSTGAGAVSWNVLDRGKVSWAVWGDDAPPARLVGEWVANGGLGVHPLVQWFERTQNPTPFTLHRVPTWCASRRDIAAWDELTTPWGIDRQLSIPLTLGPGRHQAFVLSRPATDFSDADVELSVRLRPVLLAIARHASALDGLQHSDGPVNMSAGDAGGLTPRELLVLGMTARGMGIAEIATQLYVSPRTVHKHLEHIYAKLGVNDRLSAVVRAQQAGILRARNQPEGFTAARDRRRRQSVDDFLRRWHPQPDTAVL